MKGYRKYFLSKLGWYLLTFVVAVILNFLLPRLIPGNPVDMIVGKLAQGMTNLNSQKRLYEAFMAQFGLDKPMWEQFLIYFGNLFRGDLGISFGLYPRTVSSVLRNAIPWTLGLQLPAIIVGWLLGNLLGALAAYIKGVFDKVLFPVFLFISCLPTFGFAVILLVIFAINLKIAPPNLAFGYDMTPNLSFAFIASVLQHYQLPFWSIVLVFIGGQSLGMREMSIYELNADYVKYSRLLGIKDRKIVGYVFRNAMLPQVTGLALSLGGMMGGALITETIFSYPGVGTIMLNAISQNDFPMISGCTMMITITVLAANFLVELVYGVLDPRIKAAQQE